MYELMTYKQIDNLSEELRKELQLYIEVTAYYRFHNDFEIANYVYEKIDEQVSAITFNEVVALWGQVFSFVEKVGTESDEKRVVKYRHDYNKYLRAGEALRDEHINFHAEPMTREQVTEKHDWGVKMDGRRPLKRDGIFYFNTDDLFNLYSTGSLRIHFDLPSEKARLDIKNTEKLNTILCDIGKKVADALKEAKLDVSWNGQADSPIEIHNMAFYNVTTNNRICAPRSSPSELLSTVTALLETVVPGDNFPNINETRFADTRVMIYSLEDALSGEFKAQAPAPKKKTKRKIAKDLINSVFAPLRRKGFVALDLQFPEDPVYWDEGLHEKLYKMEEDFRYGDRKSFPTKFIYYNRADLKFSEVELYVGFIKLDNYRHDLESLGTRALGVLGSKSDEHDDELINLVIEEFKKKGIDVVLKPLATLLITNLNTLVDQKMHDAD